MNCIAILVKLNYHKKQKQKQDGKALISSHPSYHNKQSYSTRPHFFTTLTYIYQHIHSMGLTLPQAPWDTEFHEGREAASLEQHSNQCIKYATAQRQEHRGSDFTSVGLSLLISKVMPVAPTHRAAVSQCRDSTKHSAWHLGELHNARWWGWRQTGPLCFIKENQDLPERQQDFLGIGLRHLSGKTVTLSAIP